MKEKILGALLALSPFSQGEAQEAKMSESDKVSPKIEQIQEKPAASKSLKDKKTANPWKVSLEANLTLANDHFSLFDNNSHNVEKSGNIVETEKRQREIIGLSADIYKFNVERNSWLKDIDKVESENGLGTYKSLWTEYKKGKIDAVEASKQFRDIQSARNLNIMLSKNNFPFLQSAATQDNVSPETAAALGGYLSMTEYLEGFKSAANDFNSGLVFMSEFLSSVKEEEISAAGLAKEIQSSSRDLSYEAKLGALSFYTQALYGNSNFGNETAGELKAGQNELDNIAANAIKYLRGDVNVSKELGVCRHLAALVSDLAAKGLGLDASEVTTDRHVVTQIKGPNGEFTLLDAANFVNNLQGRPLLTKDDVDAALIKSFREPTITDLTIEAGGNKVLYENRHNNFAGLMNNLTNRDNLSLRVPEFIAGSDKLDLFPRLSEGGTMRGAIEKGNIGLQAYWLRNNNEYSSFLSDIKGLNLAGYIPADFSLGKKKFENIFFANLGFYHSVLELAADRGGETKTLDATTSIENYLNCSLNTSLTAGIIAKLADFNLELNRTGNPLTKSGKLEYHGSLSPFISFEVPGGVKKGEDGQEKNSRTYLCSGLEVTDYLSLPDARKLSTIPWFQAGFEYNKKEIDLGLKLRGEFQPASSRFDFDSFLKKGNNQLELRTFLELYNQKFQELTPYQNVAGIEAGIRHDLKNGQNLFLMLSAKSEGGNVKQVLLNLGFKF